MTLGIFNRPFTTLAGAWGREGVVGLVRRERNKSDEGTREALTNSPSTPLCYSSVLSLKQRAITERHATGFI